MLLVVAVARSCSGGNAMYSGFADDVMFSHIETMGRIIHNTQVSSSLPGGGTGDEVCHLRLHLVWQL